MHCTTVSRRCTTDESYSREVCMADFLLKNMPRNIHTKLLNHIISFSLHNFKAILVQQCLPDYFFFLGCILISPAMHFCLLGNGSSRNILLLFLTITYFTKTAFTHFLWQGNYPEQLVYKQILDVSSFFICFSHMYCISFWLFDVNNI